MLLPDSFADNLSMPIVYSGPSPCAVQVFNAIKYSTAFPVIIFSAMKYQVTAEAWLGIYRPLWLGAALLNSSYSYFWDIERDWEIQFFTSPGALKPPSPCHGHSSQQIS